MTIEERTRQQYAKVLKDWQIEGGMIGRGSQGKTAVFKITKENSGFTETGALKIINLYETALTGNNDPLDEIEKEILLVRKSAENELAAMNRMKGHGNIVSYHEFAFEEYKSESVRGVDLLIRMDFLENIGSKIREGVIFSETEIIRMGKDLSRALADCHKKGILHRDIKPDNIFMNEYGYLLGDFGIAKYSEESDLVANTMAGSYPYAAPEQMKYTGTGNKEDIYDYRVDIYALGLSLYELANNDRIPFATSTYKRAEDIQRRLNGETLPGLSSVSKELERVILKACAYRPEDRYRTAEEMLRAFEGLSPDGTSQKPVSQVKADPDSLDETFMAVGGYQAPAEKEAPSRGDNSNNNKKTVMIAVASVAVIAVIALVIAAISKKNTPVPAPETVESSEKTEETMMEDIQEDVAGEVKVAETDDVLTEETEAAEPADTAVKGQKSEIAGTLSADPYEGDDQNWEEKLKEYTVFGIDQYKRDQISSITFLSSFPDIITEPGYPISQEKDGSVMAWFDERSDGFFDMKIAANGIIVLPQDCGYLFGGYSNVESITFNDCIDTSRVTNMKCMFSNCEKLKRIQGLDKFDTGSVNSMKQLFFKCFELSELDLSNFNTVNVLDMSYMFLNCESLNELDVKSFDTSNVQSMDRMFCSCRKIVFIDVSGFSTKNVRYMRSMFRDCESLKNIKGLDGFDTDNVVDMSEIFLGCTNLDESDKNSLARK